MRWLFASVFSGLVLVACSGAGDNPLAGDGGNNVTGDGGGGGGDGGGNTDSGLGPCDAKCGINVPNGFKLVTSTERNNACPQGFTQRDIVAEPKLADGACTCACNVTQKPTCTTGNVMRSNDVAVNPACNNPATTIALSGQACQPMNQAIYLSGTHYAATLAANGSCAWDSKPDPQKITARESRLCEVPATCQGAVCGAKSVCVVTDGDLACPPTFPTKTLIGASATAECAACPGCKLEAACGGTLSFYTDYQCTTGKADFPVDGTCNKNPAQNVTVYAYGFQGMVVKADCTGPAPMSAGTAKLAMPQTMCCTQ